MSAKKHFRLRCNATEASLVTEEYKIFSAAMDSCEDFFVHLFVRKIEIEKFILSWCKKITLQEISAGLLPTLRE